jgi:hypothetical protein
MKKSTKQFTKQQHETMETFLQMYLPSGSGIDGLWGIEFQRNRVLCRNGWHGMDEHGFYCGWAHFTLIFEYDKPIEDFRLTFAGDNFTQALARKLMLREYLPEICYHSEAVHPNRNVTLRYMVENAREIWMPRWHVGYKTTRASGAFNFAATVFAHDAAQAKKEAMSRPWWTERHEVTWVDAFGEAIQSIVILPPAKGEAA